jgi:hypothetical protein
MPTQQLQLRTDKALLREIGDELVPKEMGIGQGDRILIPCNDVDRPLERDLIIGSRVVDQCHTLLLLLEI